VAWDGSSPRRGLHATLATEAGATPHLVATALGHGSTQVAVRHYTDPGAAHRAKTRKVVDRLAKPRWTSPPAAHAPAGGGKLVTTRFDTEGPKGFPDFRK
jgi:hypothetical protein